MLKQTLLLHFKNIPGKGTPRKIVVIECDDWGSIYMPSKEVYKELLQAGFPVDKSRYTKYDTLADKTDLEQLFEVLEGVADKNGRPAVMTPVTNVANPDFDKIRASNFTEYHYEPFTKTLERYGRHPDTFATWQHGMKKGVFVPELHGREHLSSQHWLNSLQKGNRDVLKGFDLGFVAVAAIDADPNVRQFRPEFYFNHPDQVPFLIDSIKSGVELFRKLFGYTPRAFVPGNGIFHPVFEKAVADAGVRYLYVSHFMPVPDGRGGLKNKYYRPGKTIKTGLTYYTRNCAFEPTAQHYKGIELTLKQMEAAFRMGKPANISTHRVNFAGGIDPNNRHNGLLELKRLLQAILKKWPDAEFMSSADMFRVVNEK